MYCRQCGRQIADGANFCPYCGFYQKTATASSYDDAQRRYSAPYYQARQYPATPDNNVQTYDNAQCGDTKRKVNIFAILGFAMSLFTHISEFFIYFILKYVVYSPSLILIGIFLCLVPIAGLVLSIIGIKKQSLLGLAIAGTVINASWISILSFVFLVFF